MEKEKETQCNVCKIPYFERNNYFYGKLMTVRDFFAEQCYFNEKRWLINRMVNGWGVVCGLDVQPKLIDRNDPQKGFCEDKIVVTPGLAIDCCGRELLVCEEQEVPLIPEESACQQAQQDQQQAEEKTLVICLEYYECKTEALHLPPVACDQKEKCEFNRIRDSFKIRVVPVQDEEPQRPPFCPETEEDKEKLLHQYLCDRLRDNCPECPDCHCVILATVTVDQDGHLTGEIDTCSRRKLVYNNPLLYDLIHCFHGDLPHVTGLNWGGNGAEENGAELDLEEFVDPDNPDDGIYNQGLKVTFDRKMNPDTIHENTFLFLVKRTDPDTGNYHYEQIPGEVAYEYNETTGESVAKFVGTSEWRIDTYLGYSPIREKRVGEFMVVLKGDFILSAAEDGKPIKALDGNFIGGQLPSGNGTQGDDFISWFSVVESDTEKPKKKKT